MLKNVPILPLLSLLLHLINSGRGADNQGLAQVIQGLNWKKLDIIYPNTKPLESDKNMLKGFDQRTLR